MPKPTETLELEDLSDDLSALLDRADDHPLVLERDGRRYTLSRAEIGAYYDPEEFRAALREFAGFLTEEEGARMKELIYRAREAGSVRLEPAAVPSR